MTKSILSIALLLSGLFLCAQGRIKGNGNMVTKTITTESYDNISVNGFYDVVLVSGVEGKITIEAESNLIAHIAIQSDGKTLKIATEHGRKISTGNGKSITITVPVEQLSAVSLSGSGDVKTKDAIRSDHFKATLTGSGDVALHVEARTLEADITGSGDMVLSGKSDTFHCTVTGSGDLNAYGLKAGDVSAEVTGSGDCKVFCLGALQGRVSGSGDIHYKGDPRKTDNKVSGSGGINKA